MRRGLLVTVALGFAACGRAESTESPAAAVPTAADPHAPTAAVEADVLATLQTLFDALASGDGELLRSVTDPGLLMRYSETTSAGETSFGSSTLEGLVTRIESSPAPLLERMWNPVVRVSGSMATIWTPYDFYVGPDFSHCGVDAATLLETEDGWKIVSLSWTRLQPPECALHPQGPPSGARPGG